MRFSGAPIDPGMRIDGIQALVWYAERTGWDGYRELLAPQVDDSAEEVADYARNSLEDLE
jgi:hypothetical protein